MTVDRRYRNVEWNVADEQGRMYNGVNAASLAVLMDIRDALHRLNALLYCQNFIDIPKRLTAIEQNTTKRKYTRRAK